MKRQAVFSFFRLLHAWAGVLLALLLMLSGLTGALLVWKPDYQRLVVADTVADFRPTPENLAPLARAIEAGYGDNEVLEIRFPSADLPLAYVILSEERYAYFDTRGNLIDQWRGNGRPEEWLYDLHHRLLLDNLGLTIAGLGAIALMVLVLFGLVAFWPLRRGFGRGLWPKGMARPYLLVSHRNLGLLLALPLLLSLATGALLAFPRQAEEILLAGAREDPAYYEAFSQGLDEISGADSGDWLPALRRAQASFPDAEIRSAQPPGFFSPYRIIGLQQPGEWNPLGMTKVYIEAEGGWMDVRMDATAYPAVERVYNSAYPLHTGKVGGLAYKIFLSLTGLLAVALSFMGMVSFLKGKAGQALGLMR